MNHCSATIVVASLLAVIATSPCLAAESEFVQLFDGHSLAGWVQHGGEAKYTIEDDAIVGMSVANTTNSFLCTDMPRTACRIKVPRYGLG